MGRLFDFCILSPEYIYQLQGGQDRGTRAGVLVKTVWLRRSVLPFLTLKRPWHAGVSCDYSQILCSFSWDRCGYYASALDLEPLHHSPKEFPRLLCSVYKFNVSGAIIKFWAFHDPVLEKHLLKRKQEKEQGPPGRLLADEDEGSGDSGASSSRSCSCLSLQGKNQREGMFLKVE